MKILNTHSLEGSEGEEQLQRMAWQEDGRSEKLLINQLFHDEGTYAGNGEERQGGRLENDGEEKQQRFRSSLVFPVLLDVKAPIPGQVVVLVIVSKLGLYVVGATGQYSLRRLLQRGEELIVVWSRPITAHHVVRLVNCIQKELIPSALVKASYTEPIDSLHLSKVI